MKSSPAVTAEEEQMPAVFKEESSLLFELTNYLEYNGISDPLFKVHLDLFKTKIKLFKFEPEKIPGLCEHTLSAKH